MQLVLRGKNNTEVHAALWTYIDHWTAVDSSGQEKRCHSALQTAGQMDGVGVVKIIRRVCTVHAWRMCVTVVVC